MHIVVLPLDERPVNTALPAMVAAIAGASTELPPRALLPRMRVPGGPDALARWLEAAAPRGAALVVSLDMLGYGGLIASRTSHDRVDSVVRRLATLERIRAGLGPERPISAVTTVMRASDSYSSGEEPAYWSKHGRELHRLGGELHRGFAGEPNDLAGVRSAVPDDVRADYLERRLRNHTVDLAAIGLAANGTVRPLLVTADDTAERAAGSLEQVWLAHWAAALALDDSRLLGYPGADEVGAVLVARSLVTISGVRPRLAVVFPEAGGAADRVAPFENVPVATTVANQVRAAGAELVPSPEGADAVLVVHAPESTPESVPGSVPESRAAVVESVVAAIEAISLQGKGSDQVGLERLVGLADVWRPNGSDPLLARRLGDRAGFGLLQAYGGWNTAGNTIGSVVAALVAGVVGRRIGRYDPKAERRLMIHRILEDYGYQAGARSRHAGRPEYDGHQSVPFDAAGLADRYLADVLPELRSTLAGLAPLTDGWRLENPALPWNRTFEIDFEVTPDDGC